jgi:hypothetical protein
VKREGNEGGNRRERRKKELMKGEGECCKGEGLRDNQLERGADGEGRSGGSGKVREVKNG